MTKIKLGDTCEVLNGYAFKSENYVSSGIRVVRIANVQKGYIEDTDPVFYPNNSEDIDKYILKTGDLLISLTGNVGRVAKLGKEFLPAALNQRVACLRVKRSDILSDYVFHVLNNDYFEKKCIMSSKGVAQKNMSTEWLKEYEIPFVSLEQQRYIIGLFNDCQSVISARKQQLTALDTLIKARFVEMFGDPETGNNRYKILPLMDLSMKISDGVHAKPDYTESGRPFLSVVNINKHIIDFMGCKYVSEEAYQKMIKSTNPEKGDVLYTKVGATYGIAAYVDTDIDFCLYVSVCLIKPNHDKINSRFLAYQMDMPFVKHQADSRIKGIGVPDLHLNQIKEFQIICPPRELQDEFESFVTQVDKSKFVVQKALDEAQTLFDSLMQKYFG